MERETSRRGLATGAALFSLVAFIGVGCTSSASSALSSDLVRRANAVCAGWTAALNQLGPSPPLADTNRLATFTRQQLEIDRSYTAQFEALTASPTEKSALAPVNSGFEAINNEENQVLTAAAAGDRVDVQTHHQAAVNDTTTLNVKLSAFKLNVCVAP